MSKGKKNKQGKKTHQNKYASESKGEAWLKRKLAEEDKPAETKLAKPAETPKAQDNLPYFPGLSAGRSYTSLASYNVLSSASVVTSRNSLLQRNLDSWLDDSPSGVSSVEVFGLWWRYQGFSFLKNHNDAKKGFDRDEVPIIQPQLVSKIPSFGEAKNILVKGSKSEFYVRVDSSKFVELPYTARKTSSGYTAYGYKRTSNPAEVVDLREIKTVTPN